MEKNRINRILEWKKQEDKKELQRFLGVVGYYQEFTKGFSSEAAPLYDILKKNVKFVCNDNHQYYFEKLKTYTVSFRNFFFLKEIQSSFQDVMLL